MAYWAQTRKPTGRPLLKPASLPPSRSACLALIFRQLSTTPLPCSHFPQLATFKLPGGAKSLPPYINSYLVEVNPLHKDTEQVNGLK